MIITLREISSCTRTDTLDTFWYTKRKIGTNNLTVGVLDDILVTRMLCFWCESKKEKHWRPPFNFRLLTVCVCVWNGIRARGRMWFAAATDFPFYLGNAGDKEKVSDSQTQHRTYPCISPPHPLYWTDVCFVTKKIVTFREHPFVSFETAFQF